MNRKIVALITASALTLLLTACEKGEKKDAVNNNPPATTTQPVSTTPLDEYPVASPSTENSPSPSITPETATDGENKAEPTLKPGSVNTPAPTQKPSESHKPSPSQKPSSSQKPSPSNSPAPTPTKTPKPSTKPSPVPTVKPTQTPAPTPTQSPAESPKPSIETAKIIKSILAEMGDPNMMDLNADMLKDVYYIDPGVLKQFTVNLPFFNISATEIALFEVKDSKDLAIVQQGIEKRVEKLKEQWEHYLPNQYELVKNYKIQKNGNYVIMVIAKDQQKLLDIFNGFFK